MLFCNLLEKNKKSLYSGIDKYPHPLLIYHSYRSFCCSDMIFRPVPKNTNVHAISVNVHHNLQYLENVYKRNVKCKIRREEKLVKGLC